MLEWRGADDRAKTPLGEFGISGRPNEYCLIFLPQCADRWVRIGSWHETKDQVRDFANDYVSSICRQLASDLEIN